MILENWKLKIVGSIHARMLRIRPQWIERRVGHGCHPANKIVMRSHGKCILQKIIIETQINSVFKTIDDITIVEHDILFHFWCGRCYRVFYRESLSNSKMK